MYSRVLSAGVEGFDAYPMVVEVHERGGDPRPILVGLPDAAVRESLHRIRSAVLNSRLAYRPRCTTINLAPADRRKEGAGYDLPVAIGILAATGEVPDDWLAQTAFCGELALDGSLRSVRGAILIALTSRARGLRRLVLPAANAAEASVVGRLDVIGVADLAAVVAMMRGEAEATPHPRVLGERGRAAVGDYRDVVGQEEAKTALMVAAAGGHNVLLVGPPGVGKSMLASRLPGILPALTIAEAIETTKVHSVSGLLDPEAPLIREPPMRAPHHTASYASMFGGGTGPRPGEVSLAHNGVLFLDEVAEFRRSVLEVLRQPMELGWALVSRARRSHRFPARFMLVAAMNWCPCGNMGSALACRCNQTLQRRYRSSLSGPLLDRIDILQELPRLDERHLDELADGPAGLDTATMRRQVEAARGLQEERKRLTGVELNSRLAPEAIAKVCPVAPAQRILLKEVVRGQGISFRTYHRILRMARTMADLEGRERIEEKDLLMATGFRRLKARL